MFARSIGCARPARTAPAGDANARDARRARAMTRPVALGDARAVFTTSAFKANAVERARDVRARGARRSTVMAAKVAGYIKLAIEAGKASPAPPIGPALGAKVRGNISFDASTRARDAGAPRARRAVGERARRVRLEDLGERGFREPTGDARGDASGRRADAMASERRARWMRDRAGRARCGRDASGGVNRRER